MVENKKILIGTGIGILAIIAIIAVVLISGCFEEKQTPKDELLKLLAMPPEENYNASFHSWYAKSGGRDENTEAQIEVRNGKVVHYLYNYLYTDGGRSFSIQKEYFVDKGWITCKKQVSSGENEFKDDSLNCGEDYEEITEKYIKQIELNYIKTYELNITFEHKDNKDCFNTGTEFCFDKEKRFVYYGWGKM
ncbi:MAG: hypothetical protein CVU81_03070 [Euryarchaeota archaeon HGW-Euryarchaeota-1]|nr:MAG: hypothetical protein CVU81_03070 [Euryarchaeota archaeon HGW-Euryarchaeota-1]